MLPHPDDTIAAIATAAGGGVGVIRLSGPEALAIACAGFSGLHADAAPRRLYHGWWRDAAGAPLDEGLAVLMPGPASFTGEDVAELHLHGGALSLRRCLDACLDAGARLAAPGEFARRAFLNGKLDLTRAEAIADMVAARTERALSQARSHLAGALLEAATAARDRILRLRAQIEVNLDFVADDVPLIDPATLSAEAAAVARALSQLAGTWRRGHLWREGARVVLVGRPNAGKSSLFNALLGRDRAIVTPVPGTTRDVVDEAVDMLGVPVVLVDTAGIRVAADAIEAEGVARTQRQVAQADLVVHVVDPASPFEAADLHDDAVGAPILVVHSKADLHASAPPPPARAPAVGPAGPSPAAAEPAEAPGHPGELSVSATTGAGLPDLERAIVEALGGVADPGGGLTVTRERQRVALERAAAALTAAAAAIDAGLPAELAAVDVQEATDALGELVGVTTVEDVLDHLFGSFCIGK